MQLGWKHLSSRQKTLRSIVFGAIAMVACTIWYDSIVQWPRGRGHVVIACAFIGFPIQALYYGFRWRKERNT